MLVIGCANNWIHKLHTIMLTTRACRVEMLHTESASSTAQDYVAYGRYAAHQRPAKMQHAATVDATNFAIILSHSTTTTHDY